MPMDKPVAPRWSYSKDEKWRKRGTAARSPESSLLESKGAHLAETPPNCDVETRTQILGDDRTLRHKYWETEPKSPTLTVPTVIAAHSANLAETPQDVEEQSKPATNPSDGAHHAETPQIIGDTQAATKSKLFTYYGGEKEAASGSGGSCNVQVGETMPFANICDCSEQKAKDETDMDSLQICGIFDCEKPYNAEHRANSNFCSSACEKYWEEIQRGPPSVCANPECIDLTAPPHLPFCSKECKDAVQEPTTTPSNGAHHAAITSNLFTYHGGEKEANLEEKKEEAASGSGGSCNGKAAPDENSADALPDVAVESGYYCPSCCRCWKVGETIPFGGICDCSAHCRLKEGIYSTDNAQTVGFRMAIRIVNDDKLKDQLKYAWNNMSKLIGAITYIDGIVNTAGLSGPLKDIFEGPLSLLLTELKSHHEIIMVLTTWAAHEGLPYVHRGDTHPTEKTDVYTIYTPPNTPPARPPPRPTSSAANPAATSAVTPDATQADNPAATPAATSADLSILPFQQPLITSKIKDIFNHYNAGCAFNEDSQQWAIPQTHSLNLLDQFNWTKMLDCGDDFLQGRTIVSTTPTFYRDEPDSNRHNKPRLDILVEFNDGITARYHPGAADIWSTTPQPTKAMDNRYKLAASLRRKIDRARR